MTTDTDTLVKRLRGEATHWTRCIEIEAADRIEALEAEVERLVDAATKSAADCARAETQLTEARAGEDELAVNLRSIMAAYSEQDRRICCSGAREDCGCMGATVHQEAEHYASAALASHAKRKEQR